MSQASRKFDNYKLFKIALAFRRALPLHFLLLNNFSCV